MVDKTDLKYPIGLFVLILGLKIFYIFLESHYNFDVLTVTSSPAISKDIVEALNKKGHLLASTGFTLVLIPLIYYFSKNNNATIVWIKLILISSITFIVFYFSLTWFVDYIVKINKDKRYEAYYTNLVKYGISNKILYYQSYINKEQMQKFDMQERILLVNIFLLLYNDSDLVTKFKQKGEDNLVKLFLKKYKKDDLENEYNKFKELALKVDKDWKSFNSAKENLNRKLLDISNEENIKKAYKKMVDTLKNRYIEYQKAYLTLDKKIAEETSLSNLRKIKMQLNKYFKYKGYKKAQEEYSKKMNIYFGHYIEPNRWLDENEQVTYNSITNVIKQELINKVKNRVLNLPPNLNKYEFLNRIEVRIEVAKYLKQYNIFIPKNFDYSYKEFKQAYLLMLNKKIKEIKDKFYLELEKKIGKNDLTLQMNYKDFIYSHYLTSKLKEHNIKNIKIYQKILLRKDLDIFKKDVLFPQAFKMAKEKLLFSKKEFYNNPKVAKIGDEAIKMLYIPPFALSLSILALLLNSISVISMLLNLSKIPNRYINLIRITLFGFIIFIPFIIQNNIKSNKLLKQTNNLIFYKTLQWSSFWIEKNYKLYSHKSLKSEKSDFKTDIIL